MIQLIFAKAEFENKGRKNRCNLFLERVDGLIP